MARGDAQGSPQRRAGRSAGPAGARHVAPYRSVADQGSDPRAHPEPDDLRHPEPGRPVSGRSRHQSLSQPVPLFAPPTSQIALKLPSLG